MTLSAGEIAALASVALVIVGWLVYVPIWVMGKFADVWKAIEENRHQRAQEITDSRHLLAGRVQILLDKLEEKHDADVRRLHEEIGIGRTLNDFREEWRRRQGGDC